MGSQATETYLTLEEYIEFEKISESKHEYRNGKLCEMAGGKLPHNLLSGEILSLLKAAIRKANLKCQAVGSDQKIYVEPANRGIFGDVTVYCGKPEFFDDNQVLLTNPLLIVEVLSNSTKDYDKGDKFDLYRLLPSFREYLLVSQNEPFLQARFLQDPANGLWKYSEAAGLESNIQLHSLGIELSLADVYAVIDEFETEGEGDND